MSEKTLEYCFKCDEPTGCAGKADDSHYNEDGEGPFCWRCWCEDENPRLHERIKDLEGALRKIHKIAGTIEGKGTLQATEIWKIIAEQARKENKECQTIKDLRRALETMVLPSLKGFICISSQKENEIIFEQMSEYLNQFAPEGVTYTVMGWDSASNVAKQALIEQTLKETKNNDSKQ